jgi:M6 family metalloprotease-like protein
MKRAPRRFPIALVFVLTIIARPVWSVPYNGEKVYRFAQPDGTSVSARLFGDEFHAVAETMDGHTLIRDPQTGFLCFAVLDPDTGALISSGVRVPSDGSPLSASSDIPPRLRPLRPWLEAERARNRERLRIDTRGRPLPPPSVSDTPPSLLRAAPPTRSKVGEYIGLCVLVELPDQAGGLSVADVESFCNGTGYGGFGNACSVREYFAIQSRGMLDYTNVVTAYVMADHDKTHYDDNSNKPWGKSTAQELVTEVLTKLRDDGFDFGQLSRDADGYIYAVNLFYAGWVESDWNRGLWPHSWAIPEFDCGNGIKAYRYQMTDMQDELRIGTFVHENGHLLCDFPDLYAYDGNPAAIGQYCLMASGAHADGGRHPTRISGYLRLAAGWLDPVELTASSFGDYSLSIDPDTLLRYRNPERPGEYFLLEVRGDAGYEQGVAPDDGLVVYHAFESGSNTYSSLPSSFTTPYELLVLEADRTTEDWYLSPAPDKGDAFHAGGRDEIDDTTVPGTRFWAADGRTSPSGFWIHSVGSAGSTMTVSVGDPAGPGDPVLVVEPLVLSVSATVGGDAPDAGFHVRNGGDGDLAFTVRSEVEWITCEPTSAAAGDQGVDVTLRFATAAMPAGDYAGQVTVEAEGAGQSPQTVDVQLSISEASPVLVVDPLVVEAQVETGADAPDTAFRVSNGGGGELVFSIVPQVDWLSCEPADGRVGAEGLSVTLRFATASLGAGSYVGEVTVTADGADQSPQTLEVRLAVTDPPPHVPSVASPVAEPLTATTARLGGTLLGKDPVQEVGVVWSQDPGFDPGNDGVRVGRIGTFAPGAFLVDVSGLPSGEAVWFAAFAANRGGTGYSIKALLTMPPSAPASVSASDGSPEDRIVVTWSPVTGADVYRVYRAETARFEDAVHVSAGRDPEGLRYDDWSATPSLVYTYWVGAVNAAGESAVSRSDTGSFPGTGQTFVVETLDVTDVTGTAFVCHMFVDARGVPEVADSGVCWSTDHEPTVADTRTSLGAASGELSVRVEGLSPLTEYRVRAYATNADGTVYGDVLRVTTLRGEQRIDFPVVGDRVYGAAPFTPPATTDSGLEVILQSLTPGLARVDGRVVTVLDTGTVTLRASQPGDEHWSPATPVDRSFRVVKRVLRVTPQPVSRTYGATDPPVLVVYSGFVEGEGPGDLDRLPEVSITATTSSPVGEYPVTVSGAEDTRYTFQYETGRLTVAAAPLSAVARDAVRVFRRANPEFLVDYDGFVNGEGTEVLVAWAEGTCGADESSLPGEYEITVSGGEAPNYRMVPVSGVLTVTNTAPVAGADTGWTGLEDSGRLPLDLEAPFDPDGHELSLTVESVPISDHGWVTLSDGTAVGDGDTLIPEAVARLGFEPAVDFEGTAGVLEYSVSDGAARVYRRVRLEVEGVNDPPRGVTLSHATVPEAFPGEPVGRLAAVDPDTGDRHAFEVVGEGVGVFEVIDNDLLALREDVALDFETQVSYSVTVRVTDLAGESCTADLTVTVLDLIDTLRFRIGTGWNLVSVPFVPDAATPLLPILGAAAGRGDLIEVDVWDPSQRGYLHWRHGDPVPGAGFWLYSSGTGEVRSERVRGELATQSSVLVPGWNLVGAVTGAEPVWDVGGERLLAAWEWHTDRQTYLRLERGAVPEPGAACWFFLSDGAPVTLPLLPRGRQQLHDAGLLSGERRP